MSCMVSTSLSYAEDPTKSSLLHICNFSVVRGTPSIASGGGTAGTTMSQNPSTKQITMTHTTNSDSTYGDGCACSQNEIDLSAYSKIIFKISSASGSNSMQSVTAWVGVNANNSNVYSSTTRAVKSYNFLNGTPLTVEIDISSVSSGYPFFGAHQHANNNVTYTVSDFYLE